MGPLQYMEREGLLYRKAESLPCKKGSEALFSSSLFFCFSKHYEVQHKKEIEEKMMEMQAEVLRCSTERKSVLSKMVKGLFYRRPCPPLQEVVGSP